VKIFGALARTLLAVSISVSASADSCSDILFEGVFGKDVVSRSRNKADLVQQFFTSGRASEVARGKGGSIKLSLPIEGVPIGFEFGGNPSSSRKMNELAEGNYFHDKTDIELNHVMKHFADPTLVEAWLQCMKDRNKAQSGTVWGGILSASADHAIVEVQYRPAVRSDSLPRIKRISILGGEQRVTPDSPKLSIGDTLPYDGTQVVINRHANTLLTVLIATDRGVIHLEEAKVPLDDGPKKLTHVDPLEVRVTSELAFPVGDTDSLWELYQVWLEELPKHSETEYPIFEANRAVNRVLAHWTREEAQVNLANLRNEGHPQAEQMAKQLQLTMRSFTEASSPIMAPGVYTTNDRANINIAKQNGEPFQPLERKMLDQIYGGMRARWMLMGVRTR